MESARCPLHPDAAHAPQLSQVQDRFWGVDGEFDYRRCGACGTWVLDPRPEPAEIGRYYANYYNEGELASRRARQAKGTRASAPLEWGRAAQLQGMLKRAGADELEGKSVLDAGCGAGGFLAALRDQAGTDGRGVDFDARCAAFARATYDVPVDVGELAGQAYPDDSFDLVTSWHCLEHTYDPQAELHEMARVVRPGGWVMVEVPQPGWFGRLFRGRWLFLQAPTHLYHFTADTLTTLFERAGLEPARVETPWAPTEVAGSAVLSLGFKGFYRLVHGPKTWRDWPYVAAFLLLMPVDLLLTAVAAAFGGGGVLRVLARKPEAT